MMRRQRGSILLYLVLGIAILGILAGIAYQIREAGYDAAMLEVAERDRKAQAAEDARRAALINTAAQSSREALRATERAITSDNRWQEARNALRRSGKPLIAVECPAPDPKANDGNPRPPGLAAAPRLRLSWELVGLLDGAWTGDDGKPLFAGDLQRGGAAAGAAAGSSPYDPDDLLDNHGKNAASCSENTRRLTALTTKIRRLRDQWQQLQKQ